jgi:hypothetical protein
MTGRYLGAFAVAVWVAVVPGCGDNSDHCGAGTQSFDGECLPSGTITCGDGTALVSGQCAIAPAACQAGTVLIGNRCVDPTSDLVIDLEESPEPNGRAIAVGVEASTAPAGAIALKPAGQAFIVHGHLTPFRDADGDGQLDPDVDTYQIAAEGPTVLEISVAGVGGAIGGFYAIGDPAGAIQSYQRYGVSLAGATARRRMFLPVAGLYLLAIADTRSLAIGRDPPPVAGAGGAAGGAGAGYYASITVEPSGTPAPIAGSGATRTGALASDQVALFSAALVGPSDIHNAMTGRAAASIAVIAGGQLLGYADEIPARGAIPASEAEVAIDGPAPGDAVIAVDAVYNYGPLPEPFVLTIAPR